MWTKIVITMHFNGYLVVMTIIATFLTSVEPAPSLETPESESPSNLVEEQADVKAAVEPENTTTTDRVREAKSETELDVDELANKTIDADILSNNIHVVRGRTIMSAMNDVYALIFVLLDTLRSNLRSRDLFPLFTRVLDTVIQRFFPPSQGYQYISYN
ncbi:uncharacterized protein LOC111043883 [Nilaparvata lugens]|uniref:uncharacterized protein LOC111043883 n=1 Tax=Nilaparvata lugens TaxID=108931 RepID=UPI00193CB726|nr:uncharacterized protein LOC111043883 [Nilaparvata lugens]